MERVRRAALGVLQAGGLLGTGAIIWHTTVAFRLRYESPAAVLGSALGYAALAWVVGALLALAICAAASRARWSDAWKTSLRVSRIAVWFAPACILLSNLSPAAVIPAVALVFGTTRVVYSEWRSHDPEPLLSEPNAGLFQLLPSPAALRGLGPAFAVSLGVQGGFVAAGAGYPLLAAGFFAVAVSMLSLLLMMAGLMQGSPQQTLPQASMGVILTVILAAGLTTVHVLSRNPGGAGPIFGGDGDGRASGPVDSARNLMKRLTEADDIDAREPLDTATRLYRAPDAGVDITDEVFPGVVLRSGIRPRTVNVPRGFNWMSHAADMASPEPFVIPFSGEYWMYKPPYTRPPRGAIVRGGNPLDLHYRTTDHRSMSMEARQQFDHAIPLSCCRAIRVELLNGDPHPGTVSLELALLGAAGARVSLGTRRIRAWPPMAPRSAVIVPVRDTLEFPIPPRSAVESFDGLRITMGRDPVRADKSARVSIERFLLLPRT